MNKTDYEYEPYDWLGYPRNLVWIGLAWYIEQVLVYAREVVEDFGIDLRTWKYDLQIYAGDRWSITYTDGKQRVRLLETEVIENGIIKSCVFVDESFTMMGWRLARA